MKNKTKQQPEPAAIAQYNARIPATMKRAVDTVAAYIGLDNQEFARKIFARALGSKDPEVLKTCIQIEETAKTLNLSFNYPRFQSDEAEPLAA